MSGDSAYAAAPFDHKKADIILRSSDNINFRVFKLFLSLASPFFETLFDIPQPAQGSEDHEIKDGLVVVPMTEDSKTLDTLLRFCYSCTLADDPNLEVLEDMVNVLEAAKKYSLNAIEAKICRTLSNLKILEAEPLRCFAIAHREQLRRETQLAARYTLTQPLIPSTFKEIDLITAADLLALLTYHRECGDAVYALRTDILWVKSHFGSSEGCAWLSGKYPNRYGGTSDCPCPRSAAPKYKLFESYSLQWWEDFMQEMFLALREKPCAATVASLAAKTTRSVKDRNCPSCSVKITEGIRDFCDVFTRKMEEAVSRIELDFSVPRSSQIGGGSYLNNPAKGGKRGKKRKKR